MPTPAEGFKTVTALVGSRALDDAVVGEYERAARGIVLQAEGDRRRLARCARRDDPQVYLALLEPVPGVRLRLVECHVAGDHPCEELGCHAEHSNRLSFCFFD